MSWKGEFLGHIERLNKDELQIQILQGEINEENNGTNKNKINYMSCNIILDKS